MKKLLLILILASVVFSQYADPRKYIDKKGLDSLQVYIHDTTGTGRVDTDTTYLYSTSIHTDSVIASYIIGSSATSRRADSLKYGSAYFPGTSFFRSDIKDTFTTGIGDTIRIKWFGSSADSVDTAWIYTNRNVNNFVKFLGSAADSVDTAWIYTNRNVNNFVKFLGSSADYVDTAWIHRLYVDTVGGTGFDKFLINNQTDTAATTKDTIILMGNNNAGTKATFFVSKTDSTSDNIYGVSGYTSNKWITKSKDNIAVYGYAVGTPTDSGKLYGVYGITGNVGIGKHYGVFGKALGGDTAMGLYGEGAANPGGIAFGVYGFADVGDTCIGIFGKAQTGAVANYAGYFDGQVVIKDSVKVDFFVPDDSNKIRTGYLMPDSVTSKANVWTLGAGALRGSSIGGDTIYGDTTQWYVVINGKNKVKIDSKGVRLRDSIFVSTSTLDTVKLYMSNDTLSVKSKLGSYFLDLTQATVLFKPGWMLFDQIKPATNDSNSSSLGSAPTPYGHIFACSLLVAGKYPTIALTTGNDTVLTDSTQQYLTFTGRKQITINKAGVSILDTLLIPRWSAAPATGTVGSFALDTLGTDTLWAITQDGIKSVFPAAVGGTAMAKTVIMDSLAAGVGALGSDYTNFLGGGDSNTISAATTQNHCAIIGGTMDTIIGTVTFSGLFVGKHNKIQGNFSTILGGQNNTTSTATHAGIVGGLNDSCLSNQGFIGGGTFNHVHGAAGAIAGGTYNTASGNSSFQGGGDYNSCGDAAGNGGQSGIVGGYNDSIGGQTSAYSFIGAGKLNRITTVNSAIIGASNGRIRGALIDSNNVAMGMNPFVDSCRGSVAINTTIRQLDSTLAVTKQVYVIDGADTSWVRGGSIGGDCWGSGSFSATSIIDTVVTAGIAATDRFDLTWYGATLPLFPLTERVAVNTLFVYCNVLDTLKSRTEGYTYTRKTKP